LEHGVTRYGQSEVLTVKLRQGHDWQGFWQILRGDSACNKAGTLAPPGTQQADGALLFAIFGKEGGRAERKVYLTALAIRL